MNTHISNKVCILFSLRATRRAYRLIILVRVSKSTVIRFSFTFIWKPKKEAAPKGFEQSLDYQIRNYGPQKKLKSALLNKSEEKTM